MDKYTVDLDKVLNDFEYSELTEQSNGFTSQQQQQQQQQSFNTFVGPNSASNHAYSSKPTYSYESTAPYTKISANSSAKHTINNVFHSLNEYLNSDIRTELDQAAAGSSLANLNEIEADIPSLVRKTSAERLDVAKIQDIFKTITKEDENNVNVVDGVSGGVGVVNSSCPSVAVIGQNLADVKTINNNINSELNLNRVKGTNIDENLSLKVENTSVKDKNNIGKVQNTANNLVKYNKIDETSILNRSNTEANHFKPEQTNTVDETACLQVETTNIKVETTVNNEKLIETIEVHVNMEETQSVFAETITNDNKTLFEQGLPSTAVTMETVADEQSGETNDMEAFRIQPIGFKDLDDISDTEMESALAELEQEYNTELDNNSLNNTAATDDEFSVQKDLQTELAEVTCGMTVMLATDETDPTVPETNVTLATVQSMSEEINEVEIVQQFDTESGDNVHDMEEKISDSKQEFKVIADKMLEDKERVEKIMKIAWEHRADSQNKPDSENKNSVDNTDTSENVQDVHKSQNVQDNINNAQNTRDNINKTQNVEYNINNTQNSRDNINKSQNFQDNIRKSQNVEDYTDTSENKKENIDNSQNAGENIDNSQNKVEIIDESQNKQKNINKTQNKEEIIDTSKNKEEIIDTSKNNEKYTSQDKGDNAEKCQNKGGSIEKCQNKKEITEINQNKEETTETSQNKPDFQEFINKIQVAKEQFEKTTQRMYQPKSTSQSIPESIATVDIHVQQTQESADTIQQSSEICDNMQVQLATGDVPTIIETPDISVIKSEQNTQSLTSPSTGTNADIQDTPAITIQSDEVAPGTIERRNSTLLRPNSLDLAAEQQTDTLTINLIGDPGSTPYNNVYVESSLKPTTKDTQTLPEVDIEASTSLSPTLSDASTYENTDSPNTSDSCNDTSFEDQPGDKAPTTTGAAGTEPSAPGAAVAESGANPGGNTEGSLLGKTAPFWTPDSDALCCLHCNQKFTVIRRRHHCRACGLVLCAKCCNMKYKLEYMDNTETRVCLKCYDILNKEATAASSSSGSDHSPESNSPPGAGGRAGLNPNNPMDYCSTVPPHQQVGNVPNQPPTVMVPVGVLKRKGSGKSRSSKSVMFCDGIRPGCDLTELDRDFNYKDQQQQQQLTDAGTTSSSNKRHGNNVNTPGRANRNLPKIDTKTLSYIPSEENSLPPIVNVLKSDIFYADCSNNNSVVEMLKQETITFALQRNLHVQVRIINMDCCINKHAWCFTTDGMIAVGQDEIVILLEFIDNEKTVPKDVFLHLNHIYNDAVKGTSITELGLSIHPSSNFLDSKNHVGLLFVKPTFQCIQNVILPKEPYLVGILIHRWETPWAKIFPLRLLLRLGAEYRYYPSPIISTRHRESVYVEIGHTIINLLADFRNFSYTIPSVRGLTIHMEEKNTTVSIPVNRYDQVIKALNNSSDHILAFAANFSPKADSHLVCIQDTHGNNENAYTTHAINIHNKPRKVTGASFIVLNGALKSSSGLTAKSSIIEDGLMIQILPDQMVKLRSSLRNMKDFKIHCGCVNAQSDESVSIRWTENDTNFNVGVVSPIDSMSMAGIPSIRVHNGKDYVCNSGNKMIRWTEVFIIQSGEENARTQDPVDISKVSESISKATCQALVKYLDLLATNSFTKIGIRTTLHVENVSYLAGSNNTKLPPIYMKSLDNELVPVLHKITTNNFGEQAVILELVFHILNM